MPLTEVFDTALQYMKPAAGADRHSAARATALRRRIARASAGAGTKTYLIKL